ncbi:helix-turn-helix domain-containing protein [Streptomyces sp. NPDC091268]|uniref:helix-turn-helix domain-containing protein n=1 Tax=Streptomyces sp. NPDC091268 TaxID=3365979 RepID=UPI00382A0C34
MLESLGLDGPTESVYRMMLANPGDEASALAKLLGRPEEDVHEAWDTLGELGLVVPEGPDFPGRLRAVSPELGLEHLLARQQTEFAAHRQRIAASRAAASQLISEYAGLQPAAAQSGVEHLTGVEQIRARLARFTNEVEQEVMAFVPDGGQSEENMAAARPLNERLLKRGVAMRTIYVDAVRNSPPTVEHVNWLTSQGGQVRTVATLPTRMTILDRKTAIMPVNGEDSLAGAVVLSGHGTLTALCTLFDSVWEGAQPFGEAAAPRGGDDGLSRQEFAALRLLAEGHTDEGIAKRLGVSHRTARRIATVLMERLGARSRFEAGVRAVRCGWLPYEP